MQGIFARPSLRRRVIALTAAYAVVLASLIASFGAARGAAEPLAQPDGVICQHLASGEPGPASDNSTSTICDICCAGCVLMMAALPTPSMTTVAIPQSTGQRATAPVSVAPPHRTRQYSHHSRGPPLAA